MAIVGKLTDGVDQRIPACVVEALGDFDTIRGRRITQLQELERLPRPNCARAQDRIDRDALAAQVVAHFERVAFSVGGEPPAPDRVEIADRFYNAGGDMLINAIRELPDDRRVALLIGHAPGAPGLVHEMTDPASSTPEAVQAIESRFPAAALAQLEFGGDWSELDTASIIAVRLPG